MSSPKNGYRRAIATVLAAVTLAVLIYAALPILAGAGAITPAAFGVLTVFLGLHTFALTWLLGSSPWPDIDHLLDLLSGHHQDEPGDGGG
jgi:hypothetical protein